MLSRVVVFLLLLTISSSAQSPNTKTFSSYVKNLPSDTSPSSGDIFYTIHNGVPNQISYGNIGLSATGTIGDLVSIGPGTSQIVDSGYAPSYLGCSTTGDVLFNNGGVIGCAVGITAGWEAFSLGSNIVFTPPDGGTWSTSAFTVNATTSTFNSQTTITGSFGGDGALNLINTSNAANLTLSSIHGPNVGAGNSAYFNIGVADAAYNMAFFGFTYNSSGSSSNALSLGFYGHSAVLTLAGTGALTLPSLSTSGTIAGSICATSAGLILYESGASSCTISLLAVKSNVKALEPNEALNDVMKLKPVAFNMNDRPSEKDRRIGFYAENVMNSDKRLATYDGEGKLQAYEPNGIIAALTSVVQMQQKRIDRLEKKLAHVH